MKTPPPEAAASALPPISGVPPFGGSKAPSSLHPSPKQYKQDSNLKRYGGWRRRKSCSVAREDDEANRDPGLQAQLSKYRPDQPNLSIHGGEISGGYHHTRDSPVQMKSQPFPQRQQRIPPTGPATTDYQEPPMHSHGPERPQEPSGQPGCARCLTLHTDIENLKERRPFSPSLRSSSRWESNPSSSLKRCEMWRETELRSMARENQESNRKPVPKPQQGNESRDLWRSVVRRRETQSVSREDHTHRDPAPEGQHSELNLTSHGSTSKKSVVWKRRENQWVVREDHDSNRDLIQETQHSEPNQCNEGSTFKRSVLWRKREFQPLAREDPDPKRNLAQEAQHYEPKKSSESRNLKRPLEQRRKEIQPVAREGHDLNRDSVPQTQGSASESRTLSTVVWRRRETQPVARDHDPTRDPAPALQVNVVQEFSSQHSDPKEASESDTLKRYVVMRRREIDLAAREDHEPNRNPASEAQHYGLKRSVVWRKRETQPVVREVHDPNRDPTPGPQMNANENYTLKRPIMWRKRETGPVAREDHDPNREPAEEAQYSESSQPKEGSTLKRTVVWRRTETQQEAREVHGPNRDPVPGAQMNYSKPNKSGEDGTLNRTVVLRRRETHMVASEGHDPNRASVLQAQISANNPDPPDESMQCEEVSDVYIHSTTPHTDVLSNPMQRRLGGIMSRGLVPSGDKEPPVLSAVAERPQEPSGQQYCPQCHVLLNEIKKLKQKLATLWTLTAKFQSFES
ncbi:leucine-rich repeat and IQ domain-containing protein 1-like [Dipodomys merriami]|uniref:leucine-rich repeat and IQ domain-containing protein 1-like n=1 Tax=Dipodomys merriami TaxID=94247 RepID=UPI003855908E